MKRFLGGLMVLAALAVPGAADASTYRWQVAGDGNWNDPANWAVVEGPAGAGYPNLPGDVAVIDETLTGNVSRRITIPDLVSVSIGGLVIEDDNPNASNVIARLGSGSLVFDNAGGNATIESTGGARLEVPIVLNADLSVTGSITFEGIGEIGGARSVTITGGGVAMDDAPNTFTGTTTVANGSLQILPADPVTVRIPGPLVVGDGNATNGLADVTMRSGAITAASDVLIHGDGTVRFLVSPNGPLLTEIGDLTLQDGKVEIAGTLSQLQVANATMQGGEIYLGNPGTDLHLLGALTATSSATGPAVVRSIHGFQAPQLRLTTAAHDFVVADGPHAIDLRINCPIGGNGFGFEKLGAGTAELTAVDTYTGTTTLTEGILLMNSYEQGHGPVIVVGGTLGGYSPAMGPVTATGGAISPGAPGGGTATLFTYGLTLAPAAQVVVDLKGPNQGQYDALGVVGSVDLGGAALIVNTPNLVSPDGNYTILHPLVDGPITGTFAGLPEGAIVSSSSGLHFRISYVGGAGNDVVLTYLPPVTYFLTEGATGTFFDEDVLIANPNGVDAPITMTFFLPGGGTVVQQRTVPAESRLTVKVDEIDGLEATSPSVQVMSDDHLPLGVERTMFWDGTRYAGHTANAVPEPERQWYFAEGAQGGFFDTYLLLGNASAIPIEVTVTYLREGDTPVTDTVSLPAFSRETVYAGANPALVDKAFGIVAEAAQPFTAERAMYFASSPAMLWAGGHANVASAAPSGSWFHAEGASGTFFTTFILMSNPQDAPANVTLRFLLPAGNPVEITRTIPAKQRLTINPAAVGEPALRDAAFSTVVTSDVPIVSERVMYWPKGTVAFGEGHASSGVVQAADHWVLAEGRVGGPEAFTTYVLLANPGNTTSSIDVTFLRESGAPVTQTYVVPANTRFNIDVGSMVPELRNESFGVRIDVTAGSAIAVERSMYWNANGIFWSGGTNALAEVVPQPQ